ncbi:MAG: carbohydrate ABC transporter permease [Alphaproteobacteria bacterium]
MRRVALAAYAVFLLAPFYWMVNLSFQPNNDILKSVEAFPHGISHKNYLTVLGDSVWSSAFLNGLAYAGLSTIIAMAVALPAAYVISRHRFRGRQTLLGWLLANRLVPPVMFVAVYFEVARATALFDSYTAVALAHCLFTVPLAVWLLKHYMDQVSRHLEEAALLDGFSFARFFTAILLPTIRPGVITTAAFCFLFSWIEFLLAHSLTASNAAPLATTLIDAPNSSEPPWGTIAAAAVLSLLPGLVIVWAARHHIATVLSFGRR